MLCNVSLPGARMQAHASGRAPDRLYVPGPPSLGCSGCFIASCPRSLGGVIASCPLPPLPAPPLQMADELRPFFCLDLSYAHTLLTKGFKIPDDAQITLVRCLSAMPECVCLPALRRQCWRAWQQACFLARRSPLLPCSDQAKQAHKHTRIHTCTHPLRRSSGWSTTESLWRRPGPSAQPSTRWAEHGCSSSPEHCWTATSRLHAVPHSPL